MKKLVYLIVAIVALGLIVPGCLPVVPPSEQSEPTSLTRGPDDTYYVRTDGSNSNDGSANDSAHAWLTISYAIIQAAPTGDTINVAAGIYDEQVVIDKSLTLQGTGDATIIQPSVSPLTPTLSIPWIGATTKAMSAIVSVETVGGTVIIKNLKIDGSLIESKSTLWLGGLVYLETSGTIDSVTVIGNPILPDRTAGIFASAITNTANVEVTWCTVIGYNRAGIYALGEEFTADYHHNEINGPGEISTGVPNGMFFLEGANGSATYNIVTDLGYTGVGEYRSTGIGTYNAGVDIVFSHNEISFVQNAFALSTGTIGTIVEYNDIYDCHTGVRIEAGAKDSIIQYNNIHDNDFAIRCGATMGEDNEANYNNFVDNSGLGWTNEEEAEPNTYEGAVCNVHPTFIFDATHNWWGHASGPGGDFGRKNPAGKIIGKGDTVSDNVNWDPWLSQPTVPLTKILNKWDLEGTFVAKDSCNWDLGSPGDIWGYSIHIKEATGGEFSVGSIYFSTGGAEVTGIVEQTKNDYDYWFGNAGHPPIPNLAAAGRVEYDGVMYNFMFLLNEQAMWFALSDSELEPYWAQEIVWPSGLRIYQLHSTVYMGQFNMEPK